MRDLIPLCIALLLFFSVLRLLSASRDRQSSLLPGDGLLSTTYTISWPALCVIVLLAQLLLPLCLFFMARGLGLGLPWLLALTLVAAASPISGSPNLVQLLHGDDTLTLRWLIVGTALLPMTCLPIMYLLFPSESPLLLLLPSLKLLALIGGAVMAACLVAVACNRGKVPVSVKALDGAASLILALMVIGLMSAIHEPGNAGMTLIMTLCVAVLINFCLQLLGILVGILTRQPARQLIAAGVVCGNRNIALYLAALPLSLTEPLLLFIACYQIPMYLTPLFGQVFYRRLEGRA